MNESRKRWRETLLPWPEAALSAVRAAAPAALGEAAACFWLFRALHGVDAPEAALLGDYCFGRFSAHLAALDSVAWNDAFAAYLAVDALERRGLEAYLAFLREGAAWS